MSRSGSTCVPATHATSPASCTFTSLSTTTTHFENISWPSPQHAFMILRAWPGYRLSIEMSTMLWNTPSGGKCMSTISGSVLRMSGRKIRSLALPRYTSSIGGMPTMVVW